MLIDTIANAIGRGSGFMFGILDDLFDFNNNGKLDAMEQAVEVATITSGLMDLAMRLYSFGAGIFYLFLVICIIIALVSKQWMNLGILSGLLVCGLLLTVVIGVVGTIIEGWKDRAQNFIFYKSKVRISN